MKENDQNKPADSFEWHISRIIKGLLRKDIRQRKQTARDWLRDTYGRASKGNQAKLFYWLASESDDPDDDFWRSLL